jgi:riboflavin-specific deaminase-like protein
MMGTPRLRKHQLGDQAEPIIASHAGQSAEERAWTLAYAAAKATASFDTDRPARFRLDERGFLCPLTGEVTGGDLLWSPRQGWQALGVGGIAAATLDLYLPISSATARRPITLAHLGQSLDGFIATPSGDSAYVTGPENILHLHRLRALCDAVVVGAGTVIRDNPRLTTRLVAGSNPVRIVLDPSCRLSDTLTVFSDSQARTVRVCGRGRATAVPAGAVELLEVGAANARLDLPELMQILRARGYHRILVEGGGITVSSFLEAGLVDRLHIAVAPILIGDGRPAVRLPPHARLRDCVRMSHRVYQSGADVLFDCDLREPVSFPGESTTQRLL